jgi:hypothetical protein
MKLRFSVRRLLLLTACVAVICWWLDRPRQLANAFAAAVEAGDYELARSMIDPDHAKFIRLPSEQVVERPNQPPHTWGLWQPEPSLLDWFRGRRRIIVAGLAGPEGCSNPFTVTARGVHGPWGE